MLSISLLMMLVTISESCDSQVDTMGCYFNVQSNSPDCTTFDFLYCEWQVCDYYYTDSDGTSTCGSYSTVSSLSWGDCLSQCCKNSGDSQKYETLSKCYEENKNTAILIGSIIGGVIGLVIVIVIICCCRDKIS